MKRKKATYRIVFILFTLTILSCLNKKNKQTTTSISGNKNGDINNCLKKNDREIILLNILKTDDLQMYLKGLEEHSQPIEFLKNEYMTPDLNIRLDNQQVSFIDSVDITQWTFNIDFREINCKTQFVSFAIWYPFEHADITGQAVKTKNQWRVEIIGHGIVD